MKKTFILFIAMLSLSKGYSQNVGIGTSTPTTKLHIKGSGDTSQLTIDANATQSNSHPLIRLRNAAGQDLLHIHSDDATNIFIGLSAGKNNNVIGGGVYNTFIGMNTGYSNTIGTSNTANGDYSLYHNTTGSYNTTNGYASLYSNTTGSYNTANGDYSLYNNTTGSHNNANGGESLYANTTGSYNTADGKASLYHNTTGSNNTANGFQSLFYNTTGSNNIANGFQSLYNNTTGYNNAANGYQALEGNLTGIYNTANGSASMFNNTNGSYNTANGGSSMFNNSTGGHNTANGYQALYHNTSGSYNVANGYQSLDDNTTGSYNIAIGYKALTSSTTAQYNTAMGYSAGAGDIGYNNVFIGAGAGVSQNGLYNVIGIGVYTVVNANNTTMIGNSSTTTYRCYANWTNISDGRFKRNIQENVPGLAFISKLRPVTYNLKVTALDKYLHLNGKDSTGISTTQAYKSGLTEKEGITYTGFVAQDVEAAAKSLGFDFSGVDAPKNENDTYGLRYAEFVVPLVKAVQEQQQMIEDLKNNNADLQKQIDELKTLIKK